MSYYQWVVYLFGYKVIDVRWQWRVVQQAKVDEWATAAAMMESAVMVDNNGKEVT